VRVLVTNDDGVLAPGLHPLARAPTPAAAVSLAGDVHFTTAALVAASVASWLAVADRPTILNLNVPDVPLTRLRGVRAARLAPAGTAQAGLPPDPEPDVALLAAEVVRGVRAGR